MRSSLTSPSVVTAIVGVAIVLGAWYGLRSGAHETSMAQGSPPTPLTMPVQSPDRASTAGGEEDRPSEGEVVAVRQEGEGLREHLAAVRKDVRVLRGKVATLQRDLQAYATQAKTILAALEQAPTPRRRASDHRNASPEEDLAQQAAIFAEEAQRSAMRAQTNDTAFDRQAVDGLWAQQADAVLKDAFASNELHTMSPAVMECRSTLCRVEVVHTDAYERSQFEHQLPVLVGTLLPSIAMHTTERDDGSSVSVVYLSREGYPLPQDTLTND